MLATSAYTAVNASVNSLRRNRKCVVHRLHTLGELRLEDGDGQIVSRRRKLLVLLAYLCRRAPRSVSRSELVGLFWGEHDEAKARQSLRQAVLQLKQHLGDAMLIAPESVAVAVDAIDFDVAALERDESAGRDRDAIARWRGEFVAGGDERANASLSHWIDTERIGLRRRLGLAFERVLDDVETRGDWREATDVAERWSEVAPLDERAARRLVAALRQSRRHGDAIAAHVAYVSRLAEALEVAPSASFLALGASIESEAREEPSPIATALGPLPFVGRDAAFQSLNAAWNRAKRGDPQIAIVQAARGFGATRLCSEFSRAAYDRNDETLVLRASIEGRRQPGGLDDWAFARRLLAPLETVAALGGVSPEALTALQTILPNLARRFPGLSESVDDADAVSRAVGEALTVLAEDGPVLVIADGFTRADAPSRGLIASLAALKRSAVMLTITATPEDLSDDAVLAQLQTLHGSSVIPLDRFELADVEAFFSGDASIATAIHADTAGVPSLVAAELEALVTEGVLQIAPVGELVALAIAAERPLPVPSTLRASVQSTRLALSELQRRIFDILAPSHESISIEGIARSIGESASDVEDGLHQLTRVGFVREDSPGRFAIHPPIVARVANELVPNDARRIRGRPLNEPSRWRIRRRTMLGIVAGVVAIAVGAAPVIARRRAQVARPRTLAVLPFTVRGDPQIGFLRTGMVNLLSTSLDGAGGIHTIDPRAVLAASDTNASAHTVSLDAARAVASRIGASLYVQGDAVGANGSVEVEASLYSVDGNGVPLARAHASGKATELFGIIDRLSAQLAISQGATLRGEAMQLGELTTSSVTALKLYLDGEALYRINDMPNAFATFERAAKEDSTFALAWYGMASAASWMLSTKQEQFAAAQAEKTAGRLSERDRTLIRAFAAFSRGQADSAEHLASIVADAYNDVEAWVILGETLYHHNFKRGRSLTESRRAWEHVLAADPRHWPALAHLSEVAGIEGKRAEADSLLRRYEQIVGTEHVLPPSTAFRVFNLGTPHERDALVAHLASDHGFWLIASISYVAVYARNLADARRLANLLVDPLRPPEQQGFGRVLLAHLDLASGRWRDARAELAIAAAHTPLDAAEHEALLSLVPFVAEQPALRRDDADLLRRLDAAFVPPSSSLPFPNFDARMHPQLRAYLHGALAAHRGDTAVARAAMRELETPSDTNGVPGLNERLRQSISADVARANAAPDEALADLERAIGPTPFVLAWTSAFLSQARERFVRAELLRERGRDDEALRWYATFDQNSPYDLVYLGPALYHQGEILERRGRTAEARDRYTRFVDLWRDCDPEFREMRDDASRRLAHLTVASTR